MTASPEAATRIGTRRFSQLVLRRRESTIAIVALALGAYFTAANDVFLSADNLRVVSQYMIAPAILGAGQVMLLISGEIDLSLGNLYFMTPFLVYFAWQAGVPVPLAVLAGVLGAGVVGFVNGSITTRTGVPSFVVTLGMGFVLNGLTLTISDGFPKRPPSTGLAVDLLGKLHFSGLVWAILLTGIMHVVLTQTRWGVYTIATGGNLLGAAEAGVPSRRIKIGNFIFAAMLAGFAGTIEGIRIGSFDPGAGVAADKVFEAVAASVIGGTALTGGVGTVVGAFLGALVLGILRDGFNIEGVSAFTFSMVLGAAIIAAMVLNAMVGRARIRSQRSG